MREKNNVMNTFSLKLRRKKERRMGRYVYVIISNFKGWANDLLQKKSLRAGGGEKKIKSNKINAKRKKM